MHPMLKGRAVKQCIANLGLCLRETLPLSQLKKNELTMLIVGENEEAMNA